MPSSFGVNGADSLQFLPCQAMTSGTLIAFDAVPGAGTLNLVSVDGSVLATWMIPPP